MSLQVFTAHVSTRDPDRFDVTRLSGEPAGVVFAPSWAILKPALAGMKKGGREADEAWAAYVPAYEREMAASYYVDNCAAWDALLAKPRTVAVCYCPKRKPPAVLRCHRRLLASFLVRLGAVDRGEL